MAKFRVALLLLATGLVLYLARVLWLPPIGGFLVVADPLEPAEAVLPLAGNLDRITYAAGLYEKAYAEHLFLTPLPLPTRSAREAHLQNALTLALSGGVEQDDIVVVPRIARTTFGEAENVRAALETRGIRSLIVVTSPWHTRRARIALRAAFQGSTVQVSVQPVGVLERQVKRDFAHTWWRRRETLEATLSEYLKLVAYGLGVR